MTRNTRQEPEQQPDAAADSSRDHIAPAPRISVQAFCETEDTAAAIRAASQDRRLAKAHVTVKMGGIATAIDVYQRVPTPNVIILQTDGGSGILDGLDQLAGVCDPGTRVVVIGSPDDDVSYRELVRRGINDYVIGPIEPLDAIRSICSLFSAQDAVPTGRIIAVVGAKGGVGASTIAHNVAWTIGRDLALDSVVIDLDLPLAPRASTTTRTRCRASPTRCSSPTGPIPR
jgi:pilus assembly protein CpaE